MREAKTEQGKAGGLSLSVDEAGSSPVRSRLPVCW